MKGKHLISAVASAFAAGLMTIAVACDYNEGKLTTPSDEATVAEILQAAISHLEGAKPKVIVIEDRTLSVPDLSPDQDRLAALLAKFLPGVSKDLLQDFLERNSSPVSITDELTSGEPFVIFDDKARNNIETIGWVNFSSTYPGGQGVYKVSRIAFGNGASSALVFVHIQRSYNIGEGRFVLLNLDGSSWKVSRTYLFSSN